MNNNPLNHFFNQQNFYFMKKEISFRTNAKRVCTLLLVFLFCFSPWFLRAQQNYDETGYVTDKGNGVLIGTPSTRVMASIYEDETTVTMKLSAVGYMKADAIGFAFFYDPAVLDLLDEHGQPVGLNSFNDQQGSTAKRSPEIAALGWDIWGSHKKAGTSILSNVVSGHTKMNAIWYDVAHSGYDPTKLFIVDSAQVKNILEFSFQKVNSGVDLANANIGIAVKTTSIGSNTFQPKFGYDGLYLWYRDVGFTVFEDKIVNPNLFMYRSGSTVKTEEAQGVGPTSATLLGSFRDGAENLPVSNSILDTTGTVLYYKGKLRHDSVKKYGFIYSLNDVELAIDEFSNTLLINNVPYSIPMLADVSSGIHTITTPDGDVNLIIKIVGDNSTYSDYEEYSVALTGLLSHHTYYVWAYKQYSFETSDLFQSVGNRKFFITDDCIALNIGTVYTLTEPLCEGNNGEIQVFVTGGSGNYEFSLDGTNFEEYDNNIIDKLEAGTYTIYVQDKVQTTCPATSVSDIVLHNGETNLNIAVTTTEATDCESEDGILHISVTGGEPGYNFKLNGDDTPVVNGIIELPAGVYVVTVEDKNKCVASSGTIRINSGESNLAIKNYEVVKNTVCKENTGRVQFEVEGSEDFYYQVDGFPIVHVTENPEAIITISDLSAGIHYLKVWDDCKEVEREIIITNPIGAIAFTYQTENEILDCNNNLIGGSITITVEGGQLDYEYSIDGNTWTELGENVTEITIDELHTGIYRLQVRDSEKCMYEVNQIKIGRDIYEPINVGTIYASVEPTCNELGSIQVFATGGSGNYEYSTDGNDYAPYTDGIITGLQAGAYTIYVKDAKFECDNVSVTHFVLHNKNTDLSIAVTANKAEDCSSLSGELYISVTGGTPDYTYFVNGSQKTPVNGVIDGLPAGVYVVKVTDGNDCIASSGEVRITSDLSKLAVTPVTEGNTECGYTTGTVTFTVESDGEYFYQIDGYPVVKETSQDPILITGLSAGAHYLKVWDDCKEITRPFFITNGNGGLAFTFGTENEVLACDGELKGGNISLEVDFGTAPFKYSYNGSTWKDFDGNNNTVIIPELHAGTYRVEVMDKNNCVYEVNQITIGREIQKQLFVGTVFTADEPTCGLSNGSIQVFATGGSGNYEYSTDGNNFTAYTDGIITGLAAGTYTIYVQDAELSCGVVAINDVVLHNKTTDLSIAITKKDASDCTEDDGEIYVTVTGGVAPYKYFLDGDEKIDFTGTFDGLTAGVYVVKVEDNSKCIATSGEVRISSADSHLAVEITDQKDTECGFTTGSVSFKVTEFSDAYFYQLDGYAVETNNNDDVITISGLSAGVHYLKVWDACKEIVEQVTIINGNGGLAFTFEATDELFACNNQPTGGTITLNVTGGAPAYEYSYDGITWHKFDGNEASAIITDLQAGTYRVEVKDANDCLYEVNQITIGREVSTPMMVGTVKVYEEATCGQNNGSIQVFVTGGSGQYEFSTDGTNFDVYADGIITDLAAGTYDITVQDLIFTDCQNVTIYGVQLHSKGTDLYISMTADNATDCVEEDGKLFVTVHGGTAPYKPFMLNGEVAIVNNGVISGLKAGVYVLEVEDAAGCVASTGAVRISSNLSDIQIVKTVQNTECGYTTGAITFTVTGSTDYTYQLDGYPEVTPGHNDPIVITGLGAGVHTLKIWDDCGEYNENITIHNVNGGLEFEAEATNEILACNGDVIDGTITLTVTSGTPNYQYSINGIDWEEFGDGLSEATIGNLKPGTYRVEVIDGSDCMFVFNGITISHETSYGTDITAPVASSPQTFCDNATVANLQATGNDIKWYLTPNGGVALSKSHILENDVIYYASQSVGYCESNIRTAVKVFIDNNLVLDAPVITTPQNICNTSGNMTLADIATDGNPNIVWYATETSDQPLPLNTKLEATTYYAALKAGDCESADRTEVEITLDNVNPVKPIVATPQKFCEGAVIANIVVPNNKIVWYDADGNKLPENHFLETGLYYAAQKAGDCESTERTEVSIEIGTPDAPIVPAIQVICGKLTLADITVTGAGIVWYDAQIGGDILPLNTVLKPNHTYWAAQSSSAGCESERSGVTISDECYEVYGTVFPFVWNDDEEFDSKYPVTAKLFAVPEVVQGIDPFDVILASTPIQTVTATYYDGSVHIPGTPKKPGKIGNHNNPGEPIYWEAIGYTTGTPDNTVVAPGEKPDGHIGMFKFTDMAPGTYVLELSRAGYITRWGKIEIFTDGTPLGHREIVSGDVNGDFIVDAFDISLFNQYWLTNEPRFDLNGDGTVDGFDLDILKDNIKAYIGIYQETIDFAADYE